MVSTTAALENSLQDFMADYIIAYGIEHLPLCSIKVSSPTFFPSQLFVHSILLTVRAKWKKRDGSVAVQALLSNSQNIPELAIRLWSQI